MVPDEWTRYGCQLALPGFGKEGQLKLQHASVLVVGAGGLGCPAAQYLAASGVGRIGIADFDRVSMSNLHRQILYTPQELGMLKAIVACRKLQAQNPQVKLIPITQEVNRTNVLAIISDYDIILDGTDNFDSKYLLNDACVISGKPLVYGAIYQYEGQVALLHAANDDGSFSPNYRDLFPETDASAIPNCAAGGVLPTLAGIVGCIQASEVIKYITGTGDLLRGKIFLLDARTMETRIIKTGRVSKTLIDQLPETTAPNLISPEAVKHRLEKDLVALIDVRNAEERDQFHIGGKHIPLEELMTALQEGDLDKPIVFYCQSGRRSGEAAKIAAKIFPGKDFFSLDGGLRSWQESAITNQEKI